MKTQADSKTESAFSAAELAERTLHRRAVEAAIWGMPAVNAELMFQAMVQVKGDFNQVVYWSRPLSWKTRPSRQTPIRSTSSPFSTRRTRGRWCSRFRQPRRARQSPAASTMPGRPRWRMWGRQAWTRGRGENT